jgi:hypothetical protein
VPAAGRGIVRTPAVQSAIADPATVARGAARLTPGIALSNEDQ